MKVTFHFVWYDLWVGVFISQDHKRIYFNPLPCCVFLFDWEAIK